MCRCYKMKKRMVKRKITIQMKKINILLKQLMKKKKTIIKWKRHNTKMRKWKKNTSMKLKLKKLKISRNNTLQMIMKSIVMTSKIMSIIKNFLQMRRRNKSIYKIMNKTKKFLKIRNRNMNNLKRSYLKKINNIKIKKQKM